MAKPELTELQKRAVVKDLVNKSQFQVAKDRGWDKLYKSPTGAINFVNGIYREVKESPEQFTMSPEVLSMVEVAMNDRKGKGRTGGLVNVSEGEIEKINDKDLIIGVKNKAWYLLDKKLSHMMHNKKAFREESLMSIAKVAGIAFDKGQIMRGEATEHIALRAKIDPNTTGQEAISQLLKFRDYQTKEEEDEVTVQ